MCRYKSLQTYVFEMKAKRKSTKEAIDRQIPELDIRPRQAMPAAIKLPKAENPESNHIFAA
jgi:hypothetical protein